MHQHSSGNLVVHRHRACSSLPTCNTAAHRIPNAARRLRQISGWQEGLKDCQHHVAAACACPAPLPVQQQSRRWRQKSSVSAQGANVNGLATAGIISTVLSLGTLNRVLYRLALVPLKDYVFFLAQAQNVGYLLIYYTLLFLRYRQGKVTAAMLATPKPLFVLTGMCEAAAQLLMMTGAAHLPGALLPLLMQTVLLWNMLLSSLVFGTRPTTMQVLGVLAVLAGVVVASWPGGGGAAAAAAAEIEPLYLAVCIVSFAFPSLATIIKEHIFKAAAQRLGGGQQLDVLVVNAYCSTAQAGFLLLLLPLSCQLKGLSLPELPAYLKAGTDCLMGGSPLCGADCSGAPLLPLLYICVNVAFNVAAMYLVRSLGAVATALTMSCLVPITVLAFTLPLPFLQPAHLGAGFWWGSGLLMGGLLMFNARVWVPAVTQIGQKFQAKLADG